MLKVLAVERLCLEERWHTETTTEVTVVTCWRRRSVSWSTLPLWRSQRTVSSLRTKAQRSARRKPNPSAENIGPLRFWLPAVPFTTAVFHDAHAGKEDRRRIPLLSSEGRHRQIPPCHQTVCLVALYENVKEPSFLIRPASRTLKKRADSWNSCSVPMRVLSEVVD